MLFSVIVLEKDISDVSETITRSRKNGVKKVGDKLYSDRRETKKNFF